MRRPTFGSLFSGIGGFDLGLERAGWECRWQVELDPFCIRVLDRHWPGVARHGDIHAVDPERLERVDLVCGGFPCQPVSIAGKRRAQADARWLWPEFARIVRGVRPRLVLVENTPGLLERGMGDVLGDLAACGFDAEWSVISACAMGAPHARERLFIVAYAHGEYGPKGVGFWSQRQGREAALSGGNGLARARRDWLDAVASARRSSDGLPERMDRVRALGNSIVPQIAEWLGVRLLPLCAERRAEHRP